jgi:ketosteroid isomerase-like protein
MLGARELLDHLHSPAGRDYLADDVEWSLPVSLPTGIGGVHKGRPAVVAMLDAVTTQFYDPATISLFVTAAFGTDEFATQIFTVNAKSQWGQTYSNQYSITIQAADGKIARVYELCDTKHLYDTMDVDKAQNPTSRLEKE